LQVIGIVIQGDLSEIDFISVVEKRGVSCGTCGRIEGFSLVLGAFSIVAGRFSIQWRVIQIVASLLGVYIELLMLLVVAGDSLVAACSSFPAGRVLSPVAACSLLGCVGGKGLEAVAGRPPLIADCSLHYREDFIVSGAANSSSNCRTIL
jgi:hypothetical protein